MSLARDPKQVGNTIRMARKRRGWSQTELAKRVGLTQDVISKIETGYGSLKLERMLAILATLELELQIVPRSKGDWGVKE
jgi:HTH-type transcriptional regulator/antitoxin HipB